MKSRVLRGGGNFSVLGLQKHHEDPFWQIWVYDNFCSPHGDPATLKFSEIFAAPFAQNAGKGVPLTAEQRKKSTTKAARWSKDVEHINMD